MSPALRKGTHASMDSTIVQHREFWDIQYPPERLLCNNTQCSNNK